MADWSTHIYCAKKVNEELKFFGTDANLFLYGNILPDINTGWVFKPAVHIDQSITHFEAGYSGQDYFWSPRRFYEKYSDEIKARKPLFMGYLFHLWLDVAVTTDCFSRVLFSELINKGYDVRRFKRNDLNVYIRKYPQTISASDIDAVVEAAKDIDEVSVCAGDLLEVSEALSRFSKDIIEDRYFVYSEQDLDEFYEKVCKDFVNQFS